MVKNKIDKKTRRNSIGNKIIIALFVAVLSLLTMFSIPSFKSIVDFSGKRAGVPAHSKTASSNGDGTYELELSVTGDAERKVQKVNVIVIVDRSGSMDEQSGTGSYVPSNQNGTNMYGLINGEYVRLTRQNAGWGTYTYWYNGTQYTGQRYQYDATATRMQATKSAVAGLASALLEYNGNGGNPSDTVEMALVTFGTQASVNSFGGSTKTSNATTYVNAVNGITVATGNAAGTNWEDALEDANGISFGDDDPTYVIFFSDGAPTLRNTQDGHNDHDGRLPSGIYGSGQEQEPNMSWAYSNATDEAATLATSVGTDKFYTIFAYGSTEGQTYMTNLTTAAGAPSENNYSASSTAELEDAFADILENIETAGIGNAAISDGTTNQVETSTGEIAELLEVDESSYKYWLSIPVTNNTFTRVGRDGNPIVYTISGSEGNYTVTWDNGEQSVSGLNGTISDGVFKYQWTGKNALYNYDPPKAELNNGSVDWNLSPVGVLLDGVTYSVTFTVYPSQETLDIVADIKNDPGVNGAWGKLDSEVKKYIDVNGNLKTNTTATLNYVDTRTGESGSTTYTNPDPVETTAVESIAVTKAWENEIDGRYHPPVTLTVTRDSKETYTVELSEGNNWTDNVFISIGIIDKNGNVLSGSEGHDFTFKEPDNLSYHWELNVPVIRPMLINGELTMLVKVDEKHPLPEGATTYQIKGATYYVDNAQVSLTATNERRSRLFLYKEVEGEDVPEDVTFPFTFNVVNSNADNGVEGDTDSDLYVWFSVQDADGNPINEGVTGATPEDGSNGWYYAKSGSDVTIEAKAGYSVMVNNLPTDSTYTITEAENLATGFKYEKTELEIVGNGTDSTFSGNRVTTGTIESTNTQYKVTYTNKYELININVDKVWADGNDQDGLRPEELELTLNGAPSGTTVPEPEITVSEDGNTWTYTWKEMPRYNANGSEITYTVTERNVPTGYEVTGSPANDGGVITNTHTPEVITIHGTKTWNDGGNTNRPSVTIVLQKEVTDETGATSFVEVKTTALSSDNTYKFENLPKYEDGVEIIYSVKELTLGDDYTSVMENPEDYVYNFTNTLVKDITVTKTWEDGNNGKTTRPANIKVQLLADNEQVDEVTITESDNWSHTFTDLPVYNGDSEINYTITETAIDDYKTTINGYAITNTLVTSVSGTKTWLDGNGENRPESITVKLLADKQEYATTTANVDSNWEYEFTDLPVFNGTTEVVYTIDEVSVDGYKTVINGYDITNTLLTDTTVVKEWRDNNDQDGLRDDSVVVSLSNGTDVLLSKEANNWTETISNLPMYDSNNELITYTWTENNVPEGYEVAYDVNEETRTTTVINTHEPATVDVPVKKTWNDGEGEKGQDGIRPDSVTINLLADGTPTGKSITLNGSEEVAWNYTFEDLPVNKTGGVEIEYTVEEVETSVITGEDTATTYSYEIKGSVEEGFEVINTHTPEVMDVTVTKEWRDNNDQDGLRPDSISITLHGIEDYTHDLVKEDWSWTFEDLPVYNNGEPIEYTVDETLPSDVENEYSLVDIEVTDTGFNIINKHETAETTVSVKKVWADGEGEKGQDGIRPDSVTINLLADGEPTGKSVTLNGTEEVAWNYTFEGLPVNKTGGVEIEYTVEEVETSVITGEDTATTYSYEITGSMDRGYTVTNTHTPVVIDIPVAKEWDDTDDYDGFRPKNGITLNLYNGDTFIKSETMTGTGNNWSYTFEDLPKYENGVEIPYRVTETEVPEYKGEIEGNFRKGYSIKNTHIPVTLDISGEKIWQDANNYDGLRPTELVVKLTGTVDGEEVYSEEKTLTSADWTYTFTGLHKYDVVSKKEISYSVDEVEVPEGYTKGEVKGNPYSILNTHEVVPVTIEGIKTWVDEDNEFGRPESITINLSGTVGEEEVYTDSVTIDKSSANEDGDWAYSFEGLDRYYKGNKIVYSVTEEAVLDYKTTYDGNNIINTYAPDTFDISGKKTWKDDEDQDGLRPDSIIIHLIGKVGEEVKVDKKQEVTAENDWAWTFEDVIKYANGVEIKYEITEEDVDGYETKVSDWNVTNTHASATVTFIVTKEWDDDDDNDGIRPDEITVTLYKTVEGVKTKLDTYKISAANNWTYKFENLPKYENHGKPISYSVTEDAVAGYTVTVKDPVTENDGNQTQLIINTHEPETMEINGNKTWVDDNDYDQIRPDTITVNLLADGEVVGTTTSSKDNNWNYSFDGIRVYSKGKKITYTVEEVEVPFYTATYEGYNITNTHVPEKGDTDIIDPPHTDVNVVTVDYTNIMYFDDKKKYIGK